MKYGEIKKKIQTVIAISIQEIALERIGLDNG